VAELFRLHLVVAGAGAARPAGLVDALAHAGFRVDELAPDRELAQPLAEGGPDAVLLCVAGAGEAAAAEVRRHKAAAGGMGVPVLAVSLGPSSAADLLLAGADDAVAAPVDVALLRARLERLLSARQELSELRSTLRSRDLLFDIFQEVSAALRAEEVFQTLVRRVGQALSLSHCSFVLTSPDERHGRVIAVYENPAIRELKIDLDRYPELVEALRTERPVVIENVKRHPLLEKVRERWEAQRLEVNIRSAVVLPVLVNGLPAGVFFLRTKEGDPELSARDVALADTIAQAATKVLENEERRAAIYRRQSGAGSIDALTGCGSLDGLDRRLKDEFERARRYRLRFSVALVDLDNFRAINERLGAVTGDVVLAEMGRLFQRELRAPDFVARYGGDEFALVLPETDARGARNFMQRLRAIVAAHDFAAAGGTRPTFSAGIVVYPHPDVLRQEDIFRLAEGALRRAKQTPTEPVAIAMAAAG
jgi:diguanylate cyclase (GGDEF)-like protein